MSEVEYRQARFTAPAGSTDVLLIRHGESAPARPDRPFRLVDGQGDPELAPVGREHAERIAERLADEPLDAIYVTKLQRTVQTAAPLADRLGLVPRVEPDLREVHLGDWEGGLFRQKVAQNDPLIQKMYAEQRWDVIPGAESTESLTARVRGAIQRLAAAHPDQRIAVFTHGGIIGQVIALATGSRPLAFLGANNGSISQIVVTAEDGWIVRRFNDSGHVEDGLNGAAGALS
ncbi:histidine phosphatase family protein [Saccharopolyspora phatthalungensis]|uniref:Putative phosphoglycerate mutase n=1 Tax=Saccharopolyspora phatthalungensis TaxID=664693 RepID=A0A840QJC0_9PSEU|nr:histidine phosphatase family protein [Saccharopolyspora phatthalungensis]MBB5157813.1 putative phosphoglycerate mutase [Saccharopolyspora phatthalungensis]